MLFLHVCHQSVQLLRKISVWNSVTVERGDIAWGVVAGGGQGLKEPFAYAWGLVMVGRWGALRESLRSGWGSGWGCVVGGVVVGGLTRGRS